uniref:Serpin domain-containing protein n=1 Tax=Fagus sylvatica TaxID=28930 RepID=A0A2N9IX99_FAGSY
MEFSMRMAWQLTLNEINNGCNNNFVISPMSITNALNLLAVSSRGRTLEQLLGFLEAKDMDDLKHKSLLMMAAAANSNGGLILSSLNGVWIDQSFTIKPSFKKIAETVFKAEANAVDFMNKAEIVRNEVNLWAKNATRGLIKEALPHGIIDKETIFILANALYFKGAWLDAFDKKCTRHEDFYPLVGGPIQVPFMAGSTWDRHLYGSFNDFDVLKIPYQQGQDNRRFSMYVFLPHKKDGLQDLIQKFNTTPELLNNCFKLNYVRLSKMWIPKFKFSYQFEASKIMKNLGLTLPFEMVGDFTEMIDSLQSNLLSVSKILHTSCIEVNEEGTEAVAVTLISGGMGCSLESPPPPPSFVADHPFMFMIREEVSGIVFFTGTVLNPFFS